MEDSFDYSRVPSYFIHCFNAQCPRAGECLRQLAARHVTALRPVVQAVSPAVWEAEGNPCAYFRPIRCVRIAWGVRQAIGRMPYKEGQSVVKALNRIFTKATLNRITTCQRPLSPEE